MRLALVALASVALLAQVAQAQNVCVVPAKLQSSSQAKVGGTLTAPIAAVIKPNQAANFQGQVGIVFPGSCPTPDTLASALPKAFLSTPKGWSGVSVTPASASVSIGSTPIATVSVTGLQGTVTSKPGVLSAGKVSVKDPSVQAIAGVVTTKSELAQINPFNLAGQVLNVAGGACTLAPANKNTQIVFSCPNMQVNNNLKVAQGAGQLQIQGAIQAVADLASGKLVPASLIPKA